VLQYIFLKWLLAFFVGLLTGIIATLINLAVENISGYKLLAVVEYIQEERLEQITLPHFFIMRNSLS
jgi:chloride channel 7